MSDDIKTKMWEKMADSPYVMVKLDDTHDHAIPMAAQLDPDAHGAFWFYTQKASKLAPGGAAMAQFVARDHKLFACIAGTLTTESDPQVIDRYWSNEVAAWYDQGREDPDLLMLRFELSDAEIWEANPGVKGIFKMMTGATMRGDEMGEHAEVSLTDG